MGIMLSEPMMDFNTAFGEDERLAWAVSDVQGWRMSMEDAHAHEVSIGDDPSVEKRTSYFAVYDGHGGQNVAKFAGDTVHHRLASLAEFKAGDYVEALKQAFLKTDEDLLKHDVLRSDPSGCTAVATLITSGYDVICANAGDSRAVLSSGGNCVALSYDHKPVNQEERERITNAGGYIEFGRVNGNLALSRAIGDFEYKKNDSLPAEKQIVTVLPDVIAHSATEEDEFVVIACDGIWDVLASQDVVDFVRRGIANRKSLKKLCEQLILMCIAPDGLTGNGLGLDNMTLLIIALKKGRSLDEWYDWVASRVDADTGYPTPISIADPYTSVRRDTSFCRALRVSPNQGPDSVTADNAVAAPVDPKATEQTATMCKSPYESDLHTPPLTGDVLYASNSTSLLHSSQAIVDQIDPAGLSPLASADSEAQADNPVDGPNRSQSENDNGST